MEEYCRTMGWCVSATKSGELRRSAAGELTEGRGHHCGQSCTTGTIQCDTFHRELHVVITHNQRTAKTQPQLNELHSPAERLTAFCRGKCEHEAGKQERHGHCEARRRPRAASGEQRRNNDDEAFAKGDGPRKT